MENRDDIRRSFKNMRTVSLSDFKKKFRELEQRKQQSRVVTDGRNSEQSYSSRTIHVLEQMWSRPSTGKSQKSHGRDYPNQNGKIMTALEHISSLGALPRTPRNRKLEKSNSGSDVSTVTTTQAPSTPLRTSRSQRNVPGRGNLKFSDGSRLSVASFTEKAGFIDLLTTREEMDGFVRGMSMVEKLNVSSPQSPSSKRTQTPQQSKLYGNQIITKPLYPLESVKTRAESRQHSRPTSALFPPLNGTPSPLRPFTSGMSPSLSSSPSYLRNGVRTAHSDSFISRKQHHQVATEVPQDDILLDAGEEPWRGVHEDEDGHIAPFQFQPERLHVSHICLEPLRMQYNPGQVKPIPMTSSTTINDIIRDYKTMASACNRAGRSKMEALCHYRLGILYEEKLKPTPAIHHFKKYLSISQAIEDSGAVNLGHNCLGVIYQKLGGVHLRTALQYHTQHWELADTQGKIVAHINMGHVQREFGDMESSAEHYRMAFQYSLELNDKHGESIALANLGHLGMQQGDSQTAQACIERHLMLSESLNDERSMSEAYQKLGQLASQNGETRTALDMLVRGRQIAIAQGNQRKANEIKVNIGLINGQVQYEQYMHKLAQITHEHQGLEPDSTTTTIATETQT